MGLDMALYRVSKPEKISNGENTDQRTRSEKYGNVQFLEQEDGLSVTVKNHAVKCLCENTSFDSRLAIVNMFVRLGLGGLAAAEYAGSFRKKVTKNGLETVETEYKTEVKKADEIPEKVRRRKARRTE